MTQQEIDEARRGRAPQQLAGRHPRQRRRDDRHGAQGVRARAQAVAASRSPPPHRALHARQSRDSCSASRRRGTIPTPFWTYVYYHGEKWSRVRRRQAALDVRAPVVPRQRHRRARARPTTVPVRSSRSWRSRAWSRAGTTADASGARIRRSPSTRRCGSRRSTARTRRTRRALKGSITAGKLADFVMLEQDPHEVDPEPDQETSKS